MSKRLCRSRAGFTCISAVFISCFFIPVMTQAAQLTIDWEPNDPTPDGYNIYHRKESQVYDYSQPIWSGSDSSATLTVMEKNTIHHFVVRAFDQNEESSDSDEVSIALGNLFDSDNDGILDIDEINIYNTDPYAPDGDGDMIQDGTEIGLTLDALGTETDLDFFIADADPTNTTNSTSADSDGDGLKDGEEDGNCNGRLDQGESDPKPVASAAMSHILILLLSD